MDVTLIVLLILFPALTIYISWYLISYYLSPDFSKGFWFGKLLFILSVAVAVTSICFFPLDVYDASISSCNIGEEGCKAMNFTVIWYLLFIVIILLVCVVLPYAIFFYETMDIEDPPLQKRMSTACSYTVVTIIIIAALSFIFCVIVRKTDIDVYSSQMEQVNTFLLDNTTTDVFIALDRKMGDPDFLTAPEMNAAAAVSGSMKSINVDVSVLTRLIAFMCIIGWLLFVVFAGIGVIGLPYKLIYGFINRPTYMPKDKFDENKKEIGVRIQALIEQGESLTKMMESVKTGNYGWKEKRKMKKEIKEATKAYKGMCKELDEDYLMLRAEHLNYKENNPLLPLAKLVLGILAIIASILWLLQLGLYVFPKQFTGYAVNSFLNNLFISLNGYFPILASAFLLLFALYFMFCTINGAFSFGLRMLLMNVHEMEPHETLITSLVFNGGLILIVVLPLLQFCVKAFNDYAVQSSINNILLGVHVFGVQIEHLQYVSFLFKNNVFIWIMLAFIVFACFYYSCRKSDKQRSIEKTLKTLKFEDKHGIELKRIKEEKNAKDMA